jgi:hypothetical protein
MARQPSTASRRALHRARAALADAHEFIASLEPLWHSVAPSERPWEALGCSEDVWSWIAICRRPRPTSFIQDIKAIADSAGVDRDRLDRFIVTALTAERFRKAPPDQTQNRMDLLAARQRDQDEG